MTLTLTATNWGTMMGKHTAAITADQLPPGPHDGDDLVGKVVTIDDKPWRIVAVETCRKRHDPDMRCGFGYGLMVMPHTPYADAQPEYTAEIERRFGKTMDELVKEAEAGYDL